MYKYRTTTPTKKFMSECTNTEQQHQQKCLCLNAMEISCGEVHVLSFNIIRKECCFSTVYNPSLKREKKGSRTTPHEDNSPSDKNKAQPLPTRTTIPRTIPHQDNSPLGPLPRNKTTHQDQNLYGGELSSWGVVRIRRKRYDACISLD